MNERFSRASAVARIDLAHEPDFVLGRIEVRPSLREIAIADRQKTIDPRVMQVLVALGRAKGGVVSRDDLIESCWAGVIVGEKAIDRCVSRLRKVSEAWDNAFLIETVPRVGYRLKNLEPRGMPVPELWPTAAVSELSSPNSAPPAILNLRGPVRPARPKWIWAISAGAVLLLATGQLALWRFWPTAAGPPPEASVAVLPFVNMSADPEKEYISDGFSEELINDLTNMAGLRVASRTSSFAFKGRNQDVESIAQALRVHAIVEGSVREFGDHVRITAQLINGSDGYHLWSTTYDRNPSDILSLQDELARAITTALTHRLVPAPATPRPKINPKIYRLYLQGVHQFDMPQPLGLRRAFVIFEQVTSRAPDFADGFAWFARVALRLAVNFDASPASNIAVASDAAQRALSLDPHNMMSQTAHALVELFTWNWPAAASDLRILAVQNPNSYFSIGGLWNYYAILGFPDEALAIWRRLYVTEPQIYRNSIITLQALNSAGRFQEEIDMARAQLIRRPEDTQRLALLCGAYAVTRQLDEARGVNERLRDLQTDIDSEINFQNCKLSLDWASGDRANALQLLQSWTAEFPDKQVRATDVATGYILLGDFASASEWFERAYERRETAFFPSLFSKGPYKKAIAQYRMSQAYKALAEKPLFRQWEAEHDRVAAGIAAHRDPLSLR